MITPSFGLTATERVLPKLALDFTTASLDSRVTFTRTTGASNPATYVNSSGYITEATNNQPRFDYDPVTLACKGLLIEESRTNIRAYSNLVNNWSAKSNVTINDGSQLSPDNTTNASSIYANSGFAGANVRLGVSGLTNGTQYTISFYMASSSSAATRMWNLNFAGSNVYNDVRFNPQTGVALSGNTGFSVSASANGYRRYSFTFTCDSSGGLQLYFYPTNSVDNGLGVNMYGFQLEAGAFATSLIPTNGSALTRNADVAVMTGTNFSDWFNASDGTFVALSANMAAGGYSRALQVSDNTTSNFINVTTTLCQIRAAGTFYASFSSGGSVAGQFYQTTVAYKTNDCSSSTDGAAIQADATVTLPTVNQMVIGGQTTTNVGSGWIKKIMYWPSRLTNSEVRAFSKQG